MSGSSSQISNRQPSNPLLHLLLFHISAVITDPCLPRAEVRGQRTLFRQLSEQLMTQGQETVRLPETAWLLPAS